MQVIDLYPLMENAVAEVLEAMCFISAEGVASDELDQSQPNWICGEMSFTGDTSDGTFGIAAPPSTAAIIAANFLGEEEVDLTPDVTREVICELTNMICGTLLAQVDSKKAFSLSSPQAGCPRTFSGDPYKRIYRTYALDEGRIHAWIEMKASYDSAKAKD